MNTPLNNSGRRKFIALIAGVISALVMGERALAAKKPSKKPVKKVAKKPVKKAPAKKVPTKPLPHHLHHQRQQHPPVPRPRLAPHPSHRQLLVPPLRPQQLQRQQTRRLCKLLERISRLPILQWVQLQQQHFPRAEPLPQFSSQESMKATSLRFGPFALMPMDPLNSLEVLLSVSGITHALTKGPER